MQEYFQRFHFAAKENRGGRSAARIRSMNRLRGLLTESALKTFKPSRAVSARRQAAHPQAMEVIAPSFVFARQRRQPQRFLNGERQPMARRAGTDAQPRAPHAAVVTVAQLRDGANVHKDSTYLMRGRRVPVAPPT